MMQIEYLRTQKEQALKALAKRSFKEAGKLIEDILLWDDERRDYLTQANKLRAETNALAKSIGENIKQGDLMAAAKNKEKVGLIKREIAKKDEALKEIEKKIQTALYKLPNAPHASVPSGIGPEDNIVTFEWGVKPVLPEDALPHWELVKKYRIVDFDLGVKITGAGFPVYQGKGAKLQRALINFFLDQAQAAGYDEMQLPILVNEGSGYGTGQLPDKEGQMYRIEAENLFLIPTAEVPITNLYRDVLLKEAQLPIKNVGYTPCFRREAGSWGAHVRGLNRLHQFDKVEIVQVTAPEQSYAALDTMCAYVQGLLEKLALPYRKLLLCGGDMGFNSAMTYDMEVYSGAQKRWLEVSSVSNFEIYQANRLKLRYKNKEGKTELLHTLNGSALALPRIVAAILENNQHVDYIAIPAAIVPYTGFDKIDLIKK